MADPAILKKGAMKVVFFVVVLVAGTYFLWPDHAPIEWLKEEGDWVKKFAFLAWAALTAGMAYDALVVLVRGAIATPENARRR